MCSMNVGRVLLNKRSDFKNSLIKDVLAQTPTISENMKRQTITAYIEHLGLHRVFTK